VGPPELARCVSYRDIIPLLIQNKFGIQALVVGSLSSGGPALCASVLIIYIYTCIYISGGLRYEVASPSLRGDKLAKDPASTFHLEIDVAGWVNLP